MAPPSITDQFTGRLVPASRSGFLGDLSPSLGGEGAGAARPALGAALALSDGGGIVLRERLLWRFPAGLLEDLAGELERIAWSLGAHGHSPKVTRADPRRSRPARVFLHVFPLCAVDGRPGIFDGLAPAPTHPEARQLGSEGAGLRGGSEGSDDPPGREVDQGIEAAPAVRPCC